MATFYKDDEQAGQEVRREGQLGLNVPAQYKPGQIYSALRGRSYQPGQEGSEYLSRQAIKPPGATPAPTQATGSDEELISYLTGQQAAQTPESGNSDEGLIEYLIGKGSTPSAPSAPAQPESDGSLLGDLGRSLARGGISLGGGIYEIGNALTGGGLDTATQKAFGTSGTQALSGARQSLNQADSAELQRQRAELEKAEGFWSSFGTVLTNPRLLGSMALEMVPQMATVATAAKTVATRVFASELAKQTAANVTKAEAVAAANAAAGRAATYTVMGVNPVLEAGMAGSDVRSEVLAMSEADLQKSPQYQALVQQFGDTEQGRATARARLANDAATTAALVTAPISAAATFLLGGVEADIAKAAAGKIAAKATGLGEKRGLKEIGLGVAKGGAREMGQESIEEGGSQFGQNVGMVTSGADADRPLFQNVPEAAGAGGALGLVAGAGGNVRLPSSGDAPASSGTPGNTTGTTNPSRPAGSPLNQSQDSTSSLANISFTDAEFAQTINAPQAVPLLAALYDQAANDPDRQEGQPSMRQTQIQEVARRYNPTLDLAAISPNVIAEGYRVMETAAPVFLTAFNNSISEQAAKPNINALPPKPAPLDDLMNQEASINQEPDEVDAALASAEEAGVPQRALPGMDVLRRGYQRNALQAVNFPPERRQQFSAQKVQEMVERGFTREEALELFPYADPEYQGGTAGVPSVPSANQTGQTNESGTPTGFVAFRRDLVANAQAKGESVNENDYIEAPVPAEIKAIGDALGVPIYGYRYTGKSRKSQMLKGGSSANGIGINVNAKASHLNVLGHEVYHELATRDPAAAAQLTGLIQQYLSEEGKKKYKDWLKTTKYDPAKFDEEMAADVLGVMFTDAEFWAEVNRQNQTLLEKIFSVVSEMIQKLKSSVTRDEMFTKRGRAVQGFIKDYDAVRTMLAQFVADNAKKPRAEAAPMQEMADMPTEGTNVPKTEATSYQLTPEEDQRRADLYSRASAVNVAGTIDPSQMAQIDKILGFDGKFTVPQVNKFDQVEEILTRPEADMAANQERVASLGVTEEQLQNIRDAQASNAAFTKDQKDLATWRGNLDARKVEEPPKEKFTLDRPPAKEPEAKLPGVQFKQSEPEPQLALRQKIAEDEKARRPLMKKFAARADKIINQLYSPSKAREQIGELRAVMNSFGKGRVQDVRRSDAEYIFNMFGQAGALSENETEELRRSAGQTAFKASLKRKIDELESIDLENRAEAAKINIGFIAKGLSDLRTEMQQAGFTDAEIFRTLADKEFGVLAMARTLDPVNSKARVDQLTRQMEADGADRSSIRLATEELDIELSRLNDIGEQLIELGVPQDQVERTLSMVSQARDVAETAPNQAELFGEQSVVAAQLVDAVLGEEGGFLIRRIGNKIAVMDYSVKPEASNPRAFATLLAEAKYAKVGTLDILNELRMRNIQLSANIENSILRPGVMYPLEYWLKKPSNTGRDPFTLRQEWLTSLDSGLRDVEDFPAAKNAILSDLSEAESLIYNEWKKDIDAMRNRLKKGDERTAEGKFRFSSIETAFPNALFNKYLLSDMRNDDRLSDEDRIKLRYITSDTNKTLADVWLSDLNFAWDARPDLRQEMEELLSETEMNDFQRWRKARVRQEVAPDIEDVRSRAMRAVLSMRMSNSLMDAETYSRFINDVVEKIHAANANEIRAIVQNAYELTEAARAGDSSDVMDNIENVDMASEDAHTAETDEEFSFDEETETDEDAEEEAVGELNLFTSDTMPIPGSKVVVDPELGDANADPAKIYAQMRLRGVRNKAGSPISGVTVHGTITDHLVNLVKNWKSAPTFVVHENLGQLSQEEADYIRQKAGGQVVKGVTMPDGRIYLFSSALEGLEDAEFTLFHEIYGHRGLRGFLGDKLNFFLDNQYKINKPVREAADALMAEAKASGRGMTTLEATEEVIADMAADNKEPGLFQNIIRQIQRFLRSIKMNAVADWMESQSQANLAFVLSSVRKAVRNGELSPLNGAPADVRFNAEQLPHEVFAVNDSGRTSAYAVYNPFTHNWTVFYNKDGLDAKNFGIQVFHDYGDALDLVKKYGKTIKVKNNPTRVDKAPGDFIKTPTPKYWNIKGMKYWARMAQISIFSKYRPIYEVVNHYKSLGLEVDLDKTLKLYNGRIKPHFDQFRMEFIQPVAQSLNNISNSNYSYTFRNNSGEQVPYEKLDLVGLYLMAKHARERNAEIKRRARKDGKPTNIKGSGLTDKEADQILADLRKSPVIADLEAISQITQKISSLKVNYALQTGLISEYEARNMKNQYKNYVNLSGNQDEDSIEFIDESVLGGQAFNVAGKDFKYATGRSTIATDVLANTLNGYLSVIVRGQKNVVLNSVARMINTANDPNFAVINPIYSVKSLDIEKLVQDKVLFASISDKGDVDDGRQILNGMASQMRAGQLSAFQAANELQRQLDQALAQNRISSKQHEALSERLQLAITRDLDIGADGYIKEITQVTTIKDPGAIPFKVGGKTQVMYFRDGEDTGEKFGTFASALKGLGSRDQAIVLERIADLNRFVGQLLTSKNLTWVPVNWFRDMGTAYANAAADPRVGEALARKIGKYSPRAYRVAINHLMDGEYLDKNGPVYKFFKKVFKTKLTQREQTFLNEYIYSSGAPTFFMDRKDMREQLKEMQRSLDPNTGIRGTWDAYGKFADFLGIPSEMSVRFSAYMHLREAGWTKDEAAVYAKELTVNFEQSGSSRWIRSLFMFANPAIQGNVRMIRDAVVDGKLNPQFFAVAGALAGLGAVANFIARAVSADDDEETPDKLDTIARYKRATQVVLFPGAHFGAPLFLPYGWNVYYAFGQFAPDSMFFDTPVKTTVSRISSTAIDAFWPLGQSESASVFGTFVKSITPTPLAPLVDIAMNENRSGGPITKENNAFVKAEEAASWRNFSSASPISVYMLRTLNKITGGNQYRSGFIDVNPDVLDYVAGAYLPGPIADAGRLLNTSINLGMGKELKTTRLPLIDRFGSKSREENPGWDAGAYRRAQEHVQTLYKEAQTEQGERKAEILKESPGVGAAKAGLDAIDKNVRNMRTWLRSIETNKEKTSAEKVAARNHVEKMEKLYFERAVRIAMKTGFKDPVLADR